MSVVALHRDKRKKEKKALAQAPKVPLQNRCSPVEPSQEQQSSTQSGFIILENICLKNTLNIIFQEALRNKAGVITITLKANILHGGYVNFISDNLQVLHCGLQSLQKNNNNINKKQS